MSDRHWGKCKYEEGVMRERPCSADAECTRLRAELISAQREAQYNLESLADEVQRKMDVQAALAAKERECEELRAERCQSHTREGYCKTEAERGQLYADNSALRKLCAEQEEILRGCWIQCDTFKKPVMCWDMFYALEKWATGKSSVPGPGGTMADFDLEETADLLDDAAGRGEGEKHD